MKTFLATERLLVKFLQLTDLDKLLALGNDPVVMQYIDKIQTRTEAEQFLTTAITYQANHPFGFCNVFEKNSADFIGQAGLYHLAFDDTQSEMEIAYRLKPQFWGKGYATELAESLITWGFANTPAMRLIALVNPDNTRSRNVLEKVGMSYTGVVTYYGDEVRCYEIEKNIIS